MRIRGRLGTIERWPIERWGASGHPETAQRLFEHWGSINRKEPAWGSLRLGIFKPKTENCTELNLTEISFFLFSVSVSVLVFGMFGCRLRFRFCWPTEPRSRETEQTPMPRVLICPRPRSVTLKARQMPIIGQPITIPSLTQSPYPFMTSCLRPSNQAQSTKPPSKNWVRVARRINDGRGGAVTTHQLPINFKVHEQDYLTFIDQTYHDSQFRICE
jgi:hypothetical protein